MHWQGRAPHEAQCTQCTCCRRQVSRTLRPIPNATKQNMTITPIAHSCSCQGSLGSLVAVTPQSHGLKMPAGLARFQLDTCRQGKHCRLLPCGQQENNLPQETLRSHNVPTPKVGPQLIHGTAAATTVSEACLPHTACFSPYQCQHTSEGKHQPGQRRSEGRLEYERPVSTPPRNVMSLKASSCQ